MLATFIVVGLYTSTYMADEVDVTSVVRRGTHTGISNAVSDATSNATGGHVYSEYEPTSARYLGTLTSVDMDSGDAHVTLPLFGEKMTTCDRWIYFTTYKQTYVPVSYENKDCNLERVGCSRIRNGARVIVPDYANKTFAFWGISS